MIFVTLPSDANAIHPAQVREDITSLQRELEDYVQRNHNTPWKFEVYLHSIAEQRLQNQAGHDSVPANWSNGIITFRDKHQLDSEMRCLCNKTKKLLSLVVIIQMLG